MKKEKIEIWVLIFAGVLVGGLLFFALMKYILPCALPFLTAFGVALAVRAPAHKIHERTHVSERFLRPAIAILCTLLFIFGLSYILWSLGDFLWRVLRDIADEGRLYIMLERLTEPKITRLPEGVSMGIERAIIFIIEKGAEIITAVAVALPEALISVLVTLIAIVYFSVDIDRITGFIKSLFKNEYRDKLTGLGERVTGILGKYLKSYLQIMGITFVIMLAGLMILRIESAFSIAVIISVLDLLPLIGVGAVLIPWSIFSFLFGNTALGAGLIVLFLVYTVIREALEPKILGKSLDVHPVVTLVSVYLGYALFGFFGLVIFPILAVLLTGLIKKDKTAEI